MVMTAAVDLPPQVARKLAEFCAAAKSGNLQLDIRNGHIVSFKLTEVGPVDKVRR